MLKPVLLAVALLVLTGCTPAPESTPTPTAEAAPNKLACESFAALSLTLPSEIEKATKSADDVWESLRVKFDTVGLSASGVVQERMLALSSDWPDFLDIAVWHEFDDLNGQLKAVQRACIADGVNVDVGTLIAS